MSAFVSPTDPQAVEDVLRPALALLGIEGVLQALTAVTPVRMGRAGGLLRRAEPHELEAGDRILRIDRRRHATVQHVVGGVVLSTDEVLPKDLPSTIADLLCRAVEAHGNEEEASIVLTSLRDALSAGS